MKKKIIIASEANDKESDFDNDDVHANDVCK